MPIALPSSASITLRYASSANPSTGCTDSFKLLELSPEILRLIEAAGEEEPLSLTIKGRPGDDAVICTPSATFQLRNITISNSLLLFSPPSFSGSSSSSVWASSSNSLAHTSSLQLNDVCHDILEMIPTFPKLERIQRVLKESRWEGMGGEQYDEEPEGKKRKIGNGNRSAHPVKRSKHFTLPQLQSLVQASDSELLSGLRSRNVILLDSAQHLLHLPYEHLEDLLSILLSMVVIHRVETGTTTSEQVEEKEKEEEGLIQVEHDPVMERLSKDRGLSREFVEGVMKLFGKVQNVEGGRSQWWADVKAMVREMGKALLSKLPRDDPPLEDSFLKEWSDKVGGWSDFVNMKMLEGEYLLQPASLTSRLTSSDLIPFQIIPFPLSSLPTDPTARFSDLFLTKQRWRPEEMKPFLKGLTIDGDQKGMDKLVAKYVRVVKERDGGVCWHPRRLG